MRDPRFSYKHYADLFGFKAKDFVYRVIKGEKNLSEESSEAIAKGLKLKKAEGAYFAWLVRFCQAKNERQKNDAYEYMRAVLTRSRRVDFPQLLQHQQYELFSTWHYVVIRSLIEMYGFDGN